MFEDDEQLEKDARDKVLRLIDRVSDHLKIKATDDDFFNVLVHVFSVLSY